MRSTSDVIQQLLTSAITFSFITESTKLKLTSLHSSYQSIIKMMSSPVNEKLLFNAAKNGNLVKVKDLISKKTGTEYKDTVS